MNIYLYQVVVVAIAGVMLFQGIKNYAKRETGQTFLKLFVRIVIWGGMAMVAVYPNITEFFAKAMGFKENMNAVIITGFLFIFLIIFKLLSAIEKIEQNVSELTRKEALRTLPEQIRKVDSADGDKNAT